MYALPINMLLIVNNRNLIVNWFDPKKCKQYQHLVELKDALILDYANWKQSHTPEKDSIKFIDRHLEVKSNIGTVDPRFDPWLTQELGWWVIPLVDATTVRNDFSKDWPNTIKTAQEISGLLNMSINFLQPGCIIPDHSDDQWGMSSKVVNMIGIEIPSEDIEMIGFHAGGERRYLQTGGIVGFNGYSVHGGWNFSEQWRVTAVVDIDDAYWDFN